MSSITPIGLTYFVAPDCDTAGGTSKAQKSQGPVLYDGDAGKACYDKGSLMGYKLHGLTSKAGQNYVRDIINNEMNAQNLLDYMQGYEDYRAYKTNKSLIPAVGISEGILRNLGGKRCDAIFEQLRTEYGFVDNQEVMRKLATVLQEKLKKEGQVDDYNKIAKILEHEIFTRSDTRKLDNIMLDALKNLKNP